MPNTLGNYNPVDYAQETLRWLRNSLGFGSRVYRGYDRAPAEKGSVIALKRPQAYTATAMPITTATPLAPESVNVTLDQWWGVVIELTDKEQAYTKDTIIQEQIGPMAYALANKIDQLLAAQYTNIPYSNSVASALAVTDITGARKTLVSNGAPMNDGLLYLALSPTLMKEALDLSAFTQWQGAGPTGEGAQVSGTLGQRFGMNPFENQNVQTHTSGVSADATGALTANAAVGATTISFDSITTAGTVKAGDHFTIAGDTQRYAFTADFTATAGAIVGATITPPLKVAHTSTQVITITLDGAGTGKEISMAFHRDAFCLAMAVLPDSLPGIDVATAMDEQSRTSVRVRRWADGLNAKQYIGVDALFAVQTLNPNLAVRLFDV